MKQVQSEKILEALKNGDHITAIDALNRFKCFRLASRVNELRKLGWNIQMTMVKSHTGSKYGSYWLDRSAPQAKTGT